MAYLKGSRVTGLSPKPIDVKGFTQSASEDLEGTYSRHEVLLADAFNVTDNVTISDNLILTKLSDDGEAITLTGNATTTRTIAGSGSLEGSTFAQTPNASLTGMTGAIGSAVTGTLGSGVTFPAGHVLQVVSSNKSDTDSVSSATWTDITGTDNAGAGSIFCCKITPTFASSKILLSGSFTIGQMNGNNAAALKFLRDSTSIAIGDAAGSRERAFIHLYLENAGHHMANVVPNFLDSPNTTSEVTYKAQMRSEGGGYTTHINRSHTDSNALANGTRAWSNFLLMEIAG